MGEKVMPIKDSTRPLASVLTEVVSEVAYLLQTEIRLARAEFNEKLRRAGSGGAMIGISAICLLAGLIVLLFGAIRWLEIAGLANQWGLLIVGGLTLAVGLVLALVGANDLKELVPQRTIAQVRVDLSIAKDQMK